MQRDKTPLVTSKANQSHRENDSLVVVFLQMGGPKDLSEVKPFLRELFSDPMIIQLPKYLRPFQSVLARLISVIRANGTREMYQQIGGGSPILKITTELAEKVENLLKTRGISATTFVVMRYTFPRAKHVEAQIKQTSPSKLILFPLYPHYSIATSESSFRDIKAHLSSDLWSKTMVVSDWSKAEFYIDWWATELGDKISEISSAELKKTHILFSAHGLPKKYVERGDSYPKRVEEAVTAVIEKLGKKGIVLPHTLSYQSKVGPVEWLKPYTDEVIEELAKAGTQTIIVVPIGFVSDHVETLFEIDIFYKELAYSLGIKRFERIAVPNADSEFAKGLAEYLMEMIDNDKR